MTKTAVIICPGRGTYNKPELGYLARHHAAQSHIVSAFDARRSALGQKTLAQLDGTARFSQAVHTRGDNASALIYAASLLDARALHSSFDVVGVTGNSMGWYTALAVGGAAQPQDAFEIVNTMGTLMQKSLIGGQSLYPFVDENWQEIPGQRAGLLALVAKINGQADHDLAVSIHLGGMIVVAGNNAGLDAFEAQLPRVQGRFPMRLPNHAGFHTLMQAPVAKEGRALLDVSLFETPLVPLVDGRGQVWTPKACTAEALRRYTLGAQVVETYDFTKAVQVAARSFAPDVFVIPGPGATLAGAVAQSLIAINWKGIDSKESFQARQKEEPLILSMGRDEDRTMALNGLVA